MLLKEIELDLPFKENWEFINTIKEEKTLTTQEAMHLDYEENWKRKRRSFQLETRCMTAMLERTCFPIKNDAYRKILIECVNEKDYEGCRNMLGVCTVQVELDYETFATLSSLDKKKVVVDLVRNIIMEIPELSEEVSNVESALSDIEKTGYQNEWYWKKNSKYDNRTLRVKIKHEIDVVEIWLVVFEGKIVVQEKQLMTCLPDEWEYAKYLGDVGWESATEVYLMSKAGDKYLAVI